MWAVNLCSTDNCSVLEHVFKVYEVAVVHVLSKIICIVEVDDSFVVSGCNVRVQQEAACNIFTYFAGHVVTLNANNSWILVRVLLLYLFIVFFEKRHNLFVSCVLFTHNLVAVTVCDIKLCNFICTVFHNTVFYQILNLFNVESVTLSVTSNFNVVYDGLNFVIWKTMSFFNLTVSLANSDINLVAVEWNFGTATLDDSHFPLFLFLPFIRFCPDGI